MKISHKMVQVICRQKGITISDALRASGVSRNAYYSLKDKKSVLPKSILRLAETLDVAPSELLHDEAAVLKEHMALLEKVNAVVEKHPEVDPTSVRHTLALLSEPPLKRLERALRRGHGSNSR